MNKTILNSTTFTGLQIDGTERVPDISVEQLPELINELKYVLHKAGTELLSPREELISEILEKA